MGGASAGNDVGLGALLEKNRILMHPCVLGEIALGNLRNRGRLLKELSNIPRTMIADDDEVLIFIHSQALYGRGIGYIDIHLLASTVLTPDTAFWTFDRRLGEAASQLRISASH